MHMLTCAGLMTVCYAVSMRPRSMHAGGASCVHACHYSVRTCIHGPLVGCTLTHSHPYWKLAAALLYLQTTPSAYSIALFHGLRLHALSLPCTNGLKLLFPPVVSFPVHGSILGCLAKSEAWCCSKYAYVNFVLLLHPGTCTDAGMHAAAVDAPSSAYSCPPFASCNQGSSWSLSCCPSIFKVCKHRQCVNG